MKKFFIVLCCFLLVLVLAAGYVAYINRSNIESVITALKYDSEEIATKANEESEILKADINKYFEDGIREFTEEETLAIESGEKSAQEVLAEILMEAPKKEQQSAEAIIAKYTSKILSLEGKYVGKIEAILKSASAEYRALPLGQHIYQNKIKIMKKHVSTINSLEANCDKEVESYITAMEKELKEIKADTSIVEVARQSYKNEKKLRKAAYIKEYGD